MNIGTASKPDLTKAKDQEEINEKILNTMNKNFDSLYRCLRNNTSFPDNIKGTYLSDYTVYHNTSMNLPHKLSYAAQNMLILGSKHAVRGNIPVSNKNTSQAIFKLPSAIILTTTGSAASFRVTDPFSFKVNDTVRITGVATNYTISAIVGNLITLNTSVSFTQFVTELYIPSTQVNIFIF